ncbi:sensor histidine kinase [Cellulosilyticum lentocellum]|uniref:histidine kinase n=1 Tax=Cellulosilyticum lentocellum (strain ATCC 49066 / DSM 5427 / NCIMB 11756 / RHM5) TaxID=642492 RepID=F2JNR7_CELLD|nr:HAMP domain-containing sensor histidine kinase [Cellulosilyticum lentocellum]ADZ82415.1 histidine kinase [Cellulosilyticum lentocellum DSM 5427]
MKLLTIIMIVVCLVALACIIIAVKAYKEAKRTMQGLEEMLELVIKDEFNESSFDESRQSALEAKLAKFLTSSQLAQQNIKVQHRHIKSLISDISHQTKTPIANLLLYSELLKEKELPEEVSELVTQISFQSEKLDFLIRSLVKLSRLENGIITVTPTTNNLVPLINKALEEAKAKLEEKKLRLQWELSEGRYIARFDGKWTQEVFANLLDNAIKYTAEEGSITIKISEYEMFCRVDFIDTGIGITEEELALIFKRFYRSPRVAKKEGVGIGLYLAREIVVAESGYIKVTSEVGKGSCFSVFLPRSR